MATGEEVVTLKQFKVWAGKQGGGGGGSSQIELISDTPSTAVEIPKDKLDAYVHIVAHVTFSIMGMNSHTLLGMKASDTSATFFGPSYSMSLTKGIGNTMVLTVESNTGNVQMEKVYGIKEW